jgi:hypothetical protein
MENTPSTQAWNNFVMLSEWHSYDAGTDKRAASIAALFMGLVNNGGLNSFLTSSYDLDAKEVLESLSEIGALTAAQQLNRVLECIGTSLPVSSQNDRWDALEQYWSDELDDFDTLSIEADKQLMEVLERHVANHEEFYLGLGEWQYPTHRE